MSLLIEGVFFREEYTCPVKVLPRKKVLLSFRKRDCAEKCLCPLGEILSRKGTLVLWEKDCQVRVLQFERQNVSRDNGTTTIQQLIFIRYLSSHLSSLMNALKDH